jgi:hypothetical protein
MQVGRDLTIISADTEYLFLNSLFYEKPSSCCELYSLTKSCTVMDRPEVLSFRCLILATFVLVSNFEIACVSVSFIISSAKRATLSEHYVLLQSCSFACDGI